MKSSRIPFDYFLDHEASAKIAPDSKAQDTHDDADTDPNE